MFPFFIFTYIYLLIGAWSNWGNWGACICTASGATQTRARTCVQGSCTGPSTDSRGCTPTTPCQGQHIHCYINSINKIKHFTSDYISSNVFGGGLFDYSF